MRVLFVGHRNPDFPTVTEFLIRAFEQRGHPVRFVEYRDYLLPGRLVGERGAGRAIESGRLGRRFLKEVAASSPELILVNYGGWLPMEALAAARRRCGAVTVVWFADFPGNEVYRRRVLETAGSYDLVAVQGQDMAAVLKQGSGLETLWLPAAADLSDYYPVPTVPETVIRFCGSWYPRREAVLRSLEGLPLEIYGPGWQQVQPWPGCRIIPGGVGPEESRRLFASATVVLNIHLMEPWGEVPFAQVSPRVFEVLACGAFLVSDRPPDLDALLTPGTHYVPFADPAELRRRIEHYLEHPNEREPIARAGLEHVRQHHTWEHRIDRLMEALAGRECGR
jgi:spore maturation protein CgeB